MTALLTGGCQCGAVRYEITGEPETLYLCHCTECQKQSGSAFAMSLKVKAESFQVVEGEPKVWSRNTDSGGSVDCAFCPDCGTRLFHMPSRAAVMVSVKPGTLDDRSWLRPVGHLWTGSKQPWVKVPEGSLRYEGQPPDYDALIRAWASRLRN